jgi:SAM-dependent methyltransferase
MESPECLICGERTRYDGINRQRRKQRWYHCQVCDFAQVHPMPYAVDLAAYYSTTAYRDEVRKKYVGAEYKDAIPNAANLPAGPSPFEIDGEQRRAESWVRYLRPAKRHLDIGSSAGVALEMYADALGVEESVGVEPGPWGREYGARRSLYAVKAETFDLVTCFHVLEHVPDPMGFLREIRTLVGEQLAVEVPIENRVWPHITAWTIRSSQKAMGLAGLPAKMVNLTSHLKLLHDKELHG